MKASTADPPLKKTGNSLGTTCQQASYQQRILYKVLIFVVIKTTVCQGVNHVGIIQHHSDEESRPAVTP